MTALVGLESAYQSLGCLGVKAGTEDLFNDDRRGILWYQALHSRLKPVSPAADRQNAA